MIQWVLLPIILLILRLLLFERLLCSLIKIMMLLYFLGLIELIISISILTMLAFGGTLIYGLSFLRKPWVCSLTL